MVEVIAGDAPHALTDSPTISALASSTDVKIFVNSHLEPTRSTLNEHDTAPTSIDEMGRCSCMKSVHALGDVKDGICFPENELK